MKRHVVLTLGRSGSNTLCNMLNQSPEVLNVGEVLGSWSPVRRRIGWLFRSDERMLDAVLGARLFRMAATFDRNRRKRRAGEAGKPLSGIETIGFKDFTLNFERFGLMDYLQRRPEIRVIGLVRDDVVGRMVSSARLGATGVVAVRDGDGTAGAGLPGFHLDPDRLVEMLRAVERENALLDRMLSELPQDRVLRIRYADLYSSPERRSAVMAEVFGFLGVAPVATTETMRRIITRPISETIRNFDDCLAAVRGTPFEALLREAAETR